MFLEMGRVNIHTLIIDVDITSDDADFLISSIRQYRINRPSTRIILICVNREPGDYLIASLVKLGVYDIVAPLVQEEEEDDFSIAPYLEERLLKSATYADVARWDSYEEYEESEPDEKEKKPGLFERMRNNLPTVQINTSEKAEVVTPATKPVVESKVVVQERIVERFVGTHLIAIASADNGAGSTYLATQIALMLKEISNKVLCIECKDERSIKKSSLCTLVGKDSAPEGTLFEYQGVHFGYTNSPYEFINHEYNYVVLDIGKLFFQDTKGNIVQNQHIDELKRASIGILIGTGSPWGKASIEKELTNRSTYRKNWKIAINFVDDEKFSDMSKHFMTRDIDVLQVPFQPNVLEVYPETEDFLYELLEEVIPKQREKKSVMGWIKNKMR